MGKVLVGWLLGNVAVLAYVVFMAYVWAPRRRKDTPV